jgi:hypothetical protein
MAGDKVVWTDEMRRRAAEKARARRAAETPEQLAARKAKRAATVAANPDAEVKRAAAISATRRRRRDKMSAAAKEAYVRKSDEAKAASLANLKLGYGEAARLKRAETCRVPRAERLNIKALQRILESLPLPPQPPRQADNAWSEADKRRISRQQKRIWATLTAEQREARSEARRRAYAAKTDDEKAEVRAQRRRMWAAYSPEQRAAVVEKIGKASKRRWDAMPFEARVAFIHKMAKQPMKMYEMADGSRQRFRSSWEAACANVLTQLGCDYGCELPFDLVSKTYFADFVLDGNIIIEVKGHPRAHAKWRRETLPAIRQNLKGWTVYCLERNVDGKTFGTLQQFLDSLGLVHADDPPVSTRMAARAGMT